MTTVVSGCRGNNSNSSGGSIDGVIGADTVRQALEQVFSILAPLQSQLESNSLKTREQEHTGKTAVVGMQWYAEKCNELDEMTRKYRAKCREYELLQTKYNRLQSRRPEQAGKQGRQLGTAAHTGTHSVGAVRVATFDDIDELEERMKAPGSSRAKRTSAGLLVSPMREVSRTGAAKTIVEDTTPTKRVKQNMFDDDIHDLFSSTSGVTKKPVGLKTSKQPTAVAKMPLVLVHSSQETQLDFSDPCFANEHAVKLCPDSDEESADDDRDKVVWTSPARQPSKPAFRLMEQGIESSGSDRDRDARRRLLDASGICDECKRFYSVPDLALPKTDLSLLCAHNRSGKGKARDSNQGANSRRPTPKSERRLQSTPDNFWDVGFFPDIKTAGPELLRKKRDIT
ncbi:hypothetical protein FB645_005970 [Coemansia sp. IMI 203386]|nr:hypothetical protein FB645_005970 [Coemansia sp. IMI 203386]